MTSVPKVNPGDMVFWHCVSRYILLAVCFPDLFFIQDVIHAVEEEHTGNSDSAGTFLLTRSLAPRLI